MSNDNRPDRQESEKSQISFNRIKGPQLHVERTLLASFMLRKQRI
jgi:hypothetical protein